MFDESFVHTFDEKNRSSIAPFVDKMRQLWVYPK